MHTAWSAWGRPIHVRRLQHTPTFMPAYHAEVGGAAQTTMPSSVNVKAQQEDLQMYLAQDAHGKDLNDCQAP